MYIDLTCFLKNNLKINKIRRIKIDKIENKIHVLVLQISDILFLHII